MYARNVTLLSLYEFAQILEISPLHFAGVDLTSLNLSHPFCTQPWVQYAWQAGDRTSREAVGRAISIAEARIAEYLGFDPMPRFHANEKLQTAQPADPTLINVSGRSMRGWGGEVKLKRGYAIAGGCRKTTAVDIVQQNVEIDGVPTDVNVFWEADSYWEKGEITAEVPVGTDPCSIHVYFPGKGPDPTWEIRPVVVEVQDTVGDSSAAVDTAFIAVRRECCVKPELWNSQDPRAANGSNDADFLDDFDIFIETIDPSCGVEFNWLPINRCRSCGSTQSGSCPSCMIGTQGGCLTISETVQGWASFTPATWDADTGEFTFTPFSLPRQPDSVSVSYYAGYQDDSPSNPCPRRQMADEYAQAVAFYAAALLERPLCACSVDSWKYWREDPIENAANRYAATAAAISPLGTRRGATFAWEFILRHTLGKSPTMI